MTILFIYDSPLRPEAGGTERATRLVMDELQRRGHRCIGLLHADRLRPNDFFINNQSIESVYDFLVDNHVDVVVNQIAFHDWLLREFLAHGGREWKNQGGKIISFMHLDPTPPPRKKLSRYFDDWRNKTIVGKIKRVLFLFYLPILYYKTDKEYHRNLKYLYTYSDFYILMSKSFDKIFMKTAKLQDISKIRHISNMLTFNRIEDVDIIRHKEKKVIIVARLDDEQKNISFMIDVWRSIKNHRGYILHIVGDGQDRDMLVSRSKGCQDIKFEEQQSPRCWYIKSRIFLMASPREGWGLTITESLQCGTVPIVMNTSSVFRDIINDGQNGFLADSNEDFKFYLELLMSDDTVCDNMAINALSSSYRFSPKIVGDKWEETLNELYSE